MKITFELKSDEYGMMSYLGAALKLYAESKKEEETEDGEGEPGAFEEIEETEVREPETSLRREPEASVSMEMQSEPEQDSSKESSAVEEPENPTEKEGPKEEPKAETMTPAEFRKEMQELRDRLGIQSGTKLSSELAAYIRQICSERFGEPKPSQLSPENLYKFVTGEMSQIIYDEVQGFSIKAAF